MKSPTVNRSTTPTRNISGVLLISWITRLPAGGIISGMAWGRITRRNRRYADMFRAVQASCCGRGTALMEPRTTSAPYAPKFRPSAMIALASFSPIL